MRRQVNKSIVPRKLVYLVIATVCIMIGLLGLIIPVIPGILFLMVAVYYLGKVSSRVRNWSDKQPLLKKMQQKLGRLRHVEVLDRIKILSLMGLEMIVSSIAQVVNSAKRARRRFS